MVMDFKDLGEFGAKKLLEKGADYGDLFFERRTTFSSKYEDNRLIDISSGFTMGVGIRYIKNLKTYYGFTNNLAKSSIESIVNDLSSAAKLERQVNIAFEEKKPRYEEFVEGTNFDFPVREKVNLLKAANEKAREFGDRIKQVTVSLRDSIQEVTMVNTEGEVITDLRPRVVFLVLVVASDGTNLQTGYEPIGHLGDYSIFNTVKVEDISGKAAERALRMLQAKPAPAGRFDVVISSEAGGTLVHEAVGHGLEADLAGQGLSVYSNKIGQKVAAPIITVIDDGTLKGKYGSSAWDDEGMPTQRTVLIENGILKGFMYDILEAKRQGRLSTANGRRESYRYAPIPRMRNTFIAPGSSDPSDIVADTKSGVLVKRMGGGQVNTVNGDFMFEISDAYMIENGKITTPIKDASLIGNGPKVLNDIDAVGKDLGFGIGTCGKDGQGVPVSDAIPTIRIRNITVGGTK